MYYTNMANDELQQFHGLKANNYTATLTDILTSPFFAIDEIIQDTLYRIYPLFYTNKIISSNSADKILENKCIICIKTSKETYFTFISDETQRIENYTDYGTYYNIGDRLTLNEFNAYVSLLRQHVTHDEQIVITDIFNGEYGDYLFDVEGSTIVDNGLIISTETITAEPCVKLTNPFFKTSNYILKLNVLHYEGVNILEDITDEFKVVDTLEIPLKTDEWVKIPITDIGEDYIIDLNSTVTIDHKKNIIQNAPNTLILNTDKSILSKYDENTCILTAKYVNLDCEGQTVIFKANGVELGTATTNEDGIATYTYTSQGVGDVLFTAECNGLTSSKSIEDLYYYNGDVYTTTSTILDIPLPEYFELEYEITPKTRSASAPYLDIGDNQSNRMLIGQYARTGTNGIITYTGTQTNYAHPDLTLLNEVNKIKFNYKGGDYTYILNDAEMTISNKNIPFTKLIHIESGDGGELTNIKIKEINGD